MALTLTEDQLILKETARTFLEENSPVSRMRELRDAEDEVGFSRPLWKEMAEMGWAGIVFPEEYGGAGMGYAELGVVLEQCGRVLAPEPFVSTVLLGGNAILLGGSDPLKKELLSELCSGNRMLALAFQEQGRFAPYAVGTRAERDGDDYRIRGAKQFVLDAHVADPLIVVARTGGEPGERDGLALFAVDAAAQGVSIHRAVDMFCELELARSVLRDAQTSLDEDREDQLRMASAAKARCSDVAGLITREAIQMHGGIGMTDEEEIGLFFKRAKAAELTLGDATYHRDRYASLRGF